MPFFSASLHAAKLWKTRTQSRYFLLLPIVGDNGSIMLGLKTPIILASLLLSQLLLPVSVIAGSSDEQDLRFFAIPDSYISSLPRRSARARCDDLFVMRAGRFVDLSSEMRNHMRPEIANLHSICRVHERALNDHPLLVATSCGGDVFASCTDQGHDQDFNAALFNELQNECLASPSHDQRRALTAMMSLLRSAYFPELPRSRTLCPTLGVSPTSGTGEGSLTQFGEFDGPAQASPLTNDHDPNTDNQDEILYFDHEVNLLPSVAPPQDCALNPEEVIRQESAQCDRSALPAEDQAHQRLQDDVSRVQERLGDVSLDDYLNLIRQEALKSFLQAYREKKGFAFPADLLPNSCHRDSEMMNALDGLVGADRAEQSVQIDSRELRQSLQTYYGTGPRDGLFYQLRQHEQELRSQGNEEAAEETRAIRLHHKNALRLQYPFLFMEAVSERSRSHVLSGHSTSHMLEHHRVRSRAIALQRLSDDEMNGRVQQFYRDEISPLYANMAQQLCQRHDESGGMNWQALAGLTPIVDQVTILDPRFASYQRCLETRLDIDNVQGEILSNMLNYGCVATSFAGAAVCTGVAMGAGLRDYRQVQDEVDRRSMITPNDICNIERSRNQQQRAQTDLIVDAALAPLRRDGISIPNQAYRDVIRGEQGGINCQ